MPSYEDGKFRITYSKYSGRILSFREGLLENARATIDAFPGEQLNVMFSGGIDSELMLKAFVELGHPIQVFTFKYENDYNKYDVDFAVKIADDLGVKLNIVDVNITKFYESDALDLMEKIGCSHGRALIQPQFIDKVDGVPLFASGDPHFFRPHDDYSVKTEWWAKDAEYEVAWERYAELKQRKAVMNWFKFTPNFIVPMMHLTWFKQLTNDEMIGKLGVNSTKLIGYREAYDLVDRQKKTGFELTDHLVVPVQEEHRRRHGRMPYGQFHDRPLSEFKKEILGD